MKQRSKESERLEQGQKEVRAKERKVKCESEKNKMS